MAELENVMSSYAVFDSGTGRGCRTLDKPRIGIHAARKFDWSRQSFAHKKSGIKEDVEISEVDLF